MFLVGLKIPHLTICQSYNHNIMRSRKIIAKKKEIQHIHNIYNKKGICLIPIQLIEKKNIKIVIGCATINKDLYIKSLDKEKVLKLKLSRITRRNLYRSERSERS